MNWKDVIDLGTAVESEEYGETITTFTWATVYANKKSIRSKEFYDSRLVGMKPELMFEIRTVEFDNHQKVKYNNKEYAIIRTYDKGEMMELIVSSFVVE